MSNTHRIIYLAASIEQGHILKNALQEEGIFAYVTNEFADGEQHFGGMTPVKVVVHEDDAEDALEIAEEFDLVARNAALRNPLEDEEHEAELDAAEVANWPCCPHCSRPRHTSCPVCETAGSSFPQAFLPETDDVDRSEGEPHRLLVICPTCDEPFKPRFLARCEWCGHRFADGREVPLPSRSPASETNYRPWIALAGVAVVVAAVFGYFVAIVSSR